MKRWLGDLVRTLGAWWYWNTRKSLFVARGRVGQCPCHNPSDSGAPGETRCEAVVFWHRPEWFAKRVCPLLVKNAQGDWVCTVSPGGVRPFWGRVIVSHVAVAAVSVTLAGFVAWGGLRAVGFRVSARQIFWPPAWRELRQVRADLFREKAQAAMTAGRPREAVSALLVARQLNPGDYASGMLFAQLLHVAQPELVDGFYRQLMQQHPAHASETARSWCRSMLARGQMTGVAELALAQLASEPQEVASWLHALLTAVRWERNWTLLAGAATDPKLPESARVVCALELQLRRADFARARAILLAQPVPAMPYAALHRAERLIEYGESFEALELLRTTRGLLAGRDVARLTLAAHAAGRNHAALERAGAALLGAQGPDAAAGVTIVAQHLVRFSSPELLERCREAFQRLPETAERGDAAAALYCAAALGGRLDWLPEIRRQFAEANEASLVAQKKIDERLSAKNWSPLLLLAVVRPVSTDLNYAVLERLIAQR